MFILIFILLNYADYIPREPNGAILVQDPFSLVTTQLAHHLIGTAFESEMYKVLRIDSLSYG